MVMGEGKVCLVAGLQVWRKSLDAHQNSTKVLLPVKNNEERLVW
jgi:hypothetical protein